MVLGIMEKFAEGVTDTRIYLTGDFRVEFESGEDATPNAAKAKALLALLATAPRGSRSRSWIQSKLWSDRAPEQASGSLRQCLVQLRKSLADRPELIMATRQKVAIDLKRVEIVAGRGEEFLEGLEVQDEEFEEWLRAARNRDFDRAQSPSREVPVRERPVRTVKRVFIQCKSTEGEIGWLGRVLADNLARLLRETFSVDVVVGHQPTQGDDIRQIDIETFHFSTSAIGVRMSLTQTSSGAHFWANSATVDMKGAPPCEHPHLSRLANQLIQAFGDEMFLEDGPDQECPDNLCRHAIRNLFTVKSNAVEVADTMFSRAFEIEQRGLYLAWRAQVKTIQMIERHIPDPTVLSEETKELCSRALELEPNNSMVLATVANTCSLFFRAHQRGLLLAERSANLNPTNPMAWWALSTANMYAGKQSEALRYAFKAHQLADTSPHRFWWDTQVFGAALVSGRLTEAQHFAEVCHAQNPNFRPPLRYLMALYSNSGRDEDALDMARKLSALEPDFTIDRMIRDREYPASVLHRDIGIDLNKLAALA